MIKKIIPVLVILLFVGVLLISGCGTQTAPSGDGDQVNEQLGVNDINNELDTIDVDNSDFNLNDLDNKGMAITKQDNLSLTELSCNPLYPNHNSLSGDRFNFVFEGVGYSNIDEFKLIVDNFIDLNSVFTDTSHPGLFGQEPFKSNKDLFNFWYIEPVNYCENPSNSTCQELAVKYYNLCGMEHKYYFRFFSANAKFVWSPYLGVPNQNELWIWSFSPEMITGNLITDLIYIRYLSLHEFGHMFHPYQGLLLSDPIMFFILDEYYFQVYPNFEYLLETGPMAGTIIPNIFFGDNETTIEDCINNTHWKDLIGNGCGEDGVVDCIDNYTPHEIINNSIYMESITCTPNHYPDCYKEISCFEGGLGAYKQIFRPSFSSIMNGNDGTVSNLIDRGFNLPTQRYFCGFFKNELGTCEGTCNNLMLC